MQSLQSSEMRDLLHRKKADMRKHKLEYFKLTPELWLLLELSTGKKIRAYPKGLDWELFEKQAQKNRVEPLIAPRLKELPILDSGQKAVFERMKAAANQQILLSMKQCQILAQVAADFEKNGISLICLKGSMLAIELYGNPALRYSRDLDFLVSERDLEAARVRLRKMGFKEEHTAVEKTQKRRLAHKNEEMHVVFLRDDVCIELHWRISLRWEAAFEDLWERCQEKTLFGCPVYCLGELDKLNYLICHAAAHGYSRLRWLLDLYVLMARESIDYPSLYEYMAEKKTETLLLETLLLLYRCQCFQMPAIANKLFRLRQDKTGVYMQCSRKIRPCYKKAAKMLHMILPYLLIGTEEWGLTGKKYRSMLPGADQRNGNAGFLLSLVEPTPIDFERFDFPDRLYFLYYIVCPVFKLQRAIFRGVKDK